MKPCLVVVLGGVADTFYPAEHVDCRTIDLDNIKAGEPPTTLPRGLGFETFVADAGLEEGVDYEWEED